MKFFLATPACGPSMLANISAPFARLGLRFILTGSIRPETIGEWLSLSQIASVGGTWIAIDRDMRDGDWAGITTRARAAVTRAEELRP